MIRGLWKLTWVEIKIFLREPMGAVGTILMPVLLFVVMGRLVGNDPVEVFDGKKFIETSLPIFSAVVISLTGVMSLTTIIAIYRESGILKRLRATPLRPYTILGAHVLVKLILTGVSIVMLLIAGKTFYNVQIEGNLILYLIAMAYTTVCIVSMGFILASVVPTARFAQPIAGAFLYPMLFFSGLFVPVESFSAGTQRIAQLMPLTHAVALLQGIWYGESWGDYILETAALALTFVVCVAVSTRIFRWE